MSDFTEFDQQGSVPERESGSIISHAFEIYKGVFVYALLAMVIYIISSWVIQMVSGFDSYDVAESMRENGYGFSSIYSSYVNASGFGTYTALSFLVYLLLGPLFMGVIYISNKYNNKQSIQFSDLFIGYRQNLLNTLIYIFVAEIVLQITFAMCLIPGFLIAPFFLLGFPVLLFENASAGQALSKSFNIAKENYGVFFLVTFLGILISFAGFLLCCIGIIATAPFIMSVAYSSYTAFLGKPRALVES